MYYGYVLRASKTPHANLPPVPVPESAASVFAAPVTMSAPMDAPATMDTRRPTPPLGYLSLHRDSIVLTTTGAPSRLVASPGDKLIVHYHDLKKNKHSTHLVSWKVSPNKFHDRPMIRINYGRGVSEDIPILQLHLRINEGHRRATPEQVRSRDKHNAKHNAKIKAATAAKVAAKTQGPAKVDVKVAGSAKRCTKAVAHNRRPKKKRKKNTKRTKEYSVDRFLYTMTPTDGSGERVRVRWTGPYEDTWIPKDDVVDSACLKNVLKIKPDLFENNSDRMSAFDKLLKVTEQQVEQNDLFAAAFGQ